MPDTLKYILQEYGLFAATLVFFIWRDWKREQAMQKTISDLTSKLFEKTSELEKELRTILKDLVEKTTIALIDNSHVMKEVIKAIEKCNK